MQQNVIHTVNDRYTIGKCAGGKLSIENKLYEAVWKMNLSLKRQEKP